MAVRKIAEIFSTALLAALLAACAPAQMLEDAVNNADKAESVESMTENIVELQTASYEASAENVKMLGRTYFEDGLLWCGFSGSGAGFSFTGTKCEITIKGDKTSENPNNDGNYARVAVYLDGERVADEIMNEPEKTITVFESNTERSAEVKIVKLSETAMSCLAVKNITVTGTKPQPLPNKELFIEFVGDSITCGYGVDDENQNHSFSTATEDVTKAYAYKTAAALDADYSMVSISGYGIISGYTDNGQKQKSQTIPKYYEKLGFSYGSFAEGTPQMYDWDFSGREPDAVVINLGTNDDSYCQNDAEKQAEYKEGYIKFLKTVRRNNPNAKIVCALGIMGDRLFKVVEQAASEYSAETGDTSVYTVHLTPQDPADGYAADWHPTAKTHDKASAKMTESLKEILGL